MSQMRKEIQMKRTSGARAYSTYVFCLDFVFHAMASQAIVIIVNSVIYHEGQKSRTITQECNMATKEEGIQRDTWWLNELESLGVSPKVKNELNDIQETSNLAENLKQAFYQAYREAYNDSIRY